MVEEQLSHPFPGSELRTEREKRYLSIPDVCSELKLREHIIRAIESGKFPSYEKPIFMKGYIRLYANYLNQDGERFAKLYSECIGDNAQSSGLQTAKMLEEVSPTSSVMFKVVSIVVLSVLAGSIVWWSQQQYGVSDLGETSTEGQTVPEVEQAAAETNEQESSNMLDVIQNTEEALLDQSNSSSDNTLIEDPPQVTTENDEIIDDQQRTENISIVPEVQPEPLFSPAELNPSTAQGEDLYLTFTGDCWVQIRDAAGNVLFSQVARQNDIIEVSGIAPFRVVLGNAAAVSNFEFLGEPVDLSRYAPGSVARLTLPLAN